MIKPITVIWRDTKTETYRIKKELQNKTFILLLVSGIILASSISWYLAVSSDRDIMILTKITNLDKKVNESNEHKVTVIVPTQNATTGKISSAVGSGPIIVNLTK